MSDQGNKRTMGQPSLSTVASTTPLRNLVEQRAADLLSRGSGLLGMLAPVSTIAQRALQARKNVVHCLNQSAADLVQAKAESDRLVAEAESEALHNQARSLLLLDHREKHDQLLADARMHLIRGMVACQEEKSTALSQLRAVEGDPDIKALAAAAIASTYDIGLNHLASQGQFHTHRE